MGVNTGNVQVSASVISTEEFPELNASGVTHQNSSSSSSLPATKDTPPRSWADLAGKDHATCFSADTLIHQSYSNSEAHLCQLQKSVL